MSDLPLPSSVDRTSSVMSLGKCCERQEVRFLAGRANSALIAAAAEDVGPAASRAWESVASEVLLFRASFRSFLKNVISEPIVITSYDHRSVATDYLTHGTQWVRIFSALKNRSNPCNLYNPCNSCDQNLQYYYYYYYVMDDELLWL